MMTHTHAHTHAHPNARTHTHTNLILEVLQTVLVDTPGSALGLGM